MKAMKKVLALGLALAMVVTAVPVTSAQAATGLASTKTYAAGKTYTLKLTTPSSWKSVSTKWSVGNSSVAKLSDQANKSVKVEAVKKGRTKVTAKVTYKNSGKNASKTYKCTVTVKNPGVRMAEAPTVVVGQKVNATTKIWPASATVAYKSSDETIATVDANGEVTGVKAGKATITATMTCGTKVFDRTTEVTVTKVLLQDAAQTEFNKIKVTILGDTTDLKAGDFKVTNKATNGTVAVKSVDAVRGEADKFVITTHTSMVDAKEYVVAYGNSEASFTATDGAVAKVGVSRIQVPAGERTTVQLTTADANDVVLGYTDLQNSDSSRGKVTAETTYTKGYVDGSIVYLPTVGDTMTVKVTYHTGTFGTDGKEAGNIEGTFTITAVDPSIVNYSFAMTIAANAPAWNADSFVANNRIAIGSTGNAYFRIVNDFGIDIVDYSDYIVESADKTKLLVANVPLTSNSTAVQVEGVAEGTTYVLVKRVDTGATVASLPVVVQGRPVATTLDLSKTSVNVVTGVAVNEIIAMTLKDQYGNPMNIDSATVALLGKPNTSVKTDADFASAADAATKTVTVKGTDFDQLGTYTLKISAKNGNRTLDRTLQVTLVKDTGTRAYEVRFDKQTVDTTIGTGTVTPSNTDITVNVAKLVNGGAQAMVADSVKYTVKNAKNEVIAYYDPANPAATVTCAAISAMTDNGTLNITPITVSSQGGRVYDKNLAAGTYTVTAEFTADDSKPAKVVGSFTVTDTQNSRASFKINNNNFGGNSVAAGFADSTLVDVYYDGIKQSLSVSDIIKVDGVALTNGGAYVRTVTLYVTVSGSANKVPVTINVNDQIAACAGLQ